MKKIYESKALELILQQVALEFNLTIEEVREIYLNLRIEEIKSEALEEALIQQISEILRAIGASEDPDEFEVDSLPGLMESAIYNIQSVEELDKFKAIDDARLNEGSACVENLDILDSQARAYFNCPNKHYLSENETEPLITCYLSLYSHTHYDLSNMPVDFYKATGVSFKLTLSEASSLEGIGKGVRSVGYEMDSSIQVKLYGYSLYDLVGAKAYSKDEPTLFVPYFQECPYVLLAVPDSQAVCDYQDGIYETLNKMVNEEILYGRSASDVLGRAYDSWCLTQEFYEVRLPAIEEEDFSVSLEKKLASRIKSKTQFRDGFVKEVELIKALNNKKCNLSDLINLTSHELNRILYVCRSNDLSARLESKTIYMQLQSMAHRKSQSAKTSPSIKSAA